MSRRCTICDHPASKEINKCLVKGQSIRSIARQFSVDDSAIFRHQKHLQKILTKAKEKPQKDPATIQREQDEKELVKMASENETKEIQDAGDLLAQLKEWMTRTESIYRQAEEAKDLRAALQAVREGRGNLELLGKLIGELQDGVTINLYNHPVWIDLRAVILTALAPYPEAKEALVNALAGLGR